MYCFATLREQPFIPVGLLWLLLTSGGLNIWGSPQNVLSCCLRVLWLPSRFQLDLNQTPIALRTATRQTSPDKRVNCLCTTASFTVFPEPEGFVVLCQLAPGLSQPSMTFLFVGSQICRWLPSDPSSRKCPCLKLGVIVTRLQDFRAFGRWFSSKGLSPH
jgi:hypothetical protein